MTNRRRMIGIAATLFVLLPVTAKASASPADDERAKAATIAAQRQRIIVDAERINERQLATTLEMDQLAKQQARLEIQAAVSDQSMQSLSGQASALAIQAYIAGSDASPIAAIAAAPKANDIPVREGYASVLLGSTKDAVDQIQAARDDTQAVTKQLVKVQAQGRMLQASLAADQSRLAKADAELAELARTTDTKIASLVEEEQNRLVREAAQKAAAAAIKPTPPAARAIALTPVVLKSTKTPTEVAPKVANTVATRPAAQTATPVVAKPAAPGITAATKPTNSTASTTKAKPATSKPTSPKTTAAPSGAEPTASGDAPADNADPAEGDPAPEPTQPQATQPASRPPTTTAPTTAAPRQTYPAPSAAAGIAVGEAMRQLGKAYIFGAAGPNNFDCSGLTQWAWAKAGVSMDHYTGSQFNSFPHVPLDQIQPGDLVFLRVDLGHMGMYIGGGEFIHAPRTGEVVKISSLSSARIAGVVRPG